MKRYAFLLTVCVLLLVARGAYAFIARTGDLVQITSEEVITEDLYIAGEEIEIDGTVNASIYAAGRKVTIRGAVKDHVVVFAQEVVLLGSVGKGFKGFAANLTMQGSVGGDLLLFGANIDIRETAAVSGDVLFGGRLISIEGPLKKDLLGAGQRITLNGSVGGNVKLAVQELSILESVRIKGNVKYYSENEADIQPGATIQGTITRRIPEYREKLKQVFPFVLIVGIAGKIIAFFMALVVGLVFILLTPVWMQSLSDAIAEKPGRCAGWGALILFVAPLAMATAFATVVGIPLAGIALLLYLVAIIVSQIALGLLIGRLIIGRERSAESKGLLFAAFVLGLVILRLLRFIPVFGHIVVLVCGIFGIGAIVVAEAARRREGRLSSL